MWQKLKWVSPNIFQKKCNKNNIFITKCSFVIFSLRGVFKKKGRVGYLFYDRTRHGRGVWSCRVWSCGVRSCGVWKLWYYYSWKFGYCIRLIYPVLIRVTIKKYPDKIWFIRVTIKKYPDTIWFIRGTIQNTRI
jgi:hypothetical protein